MRIWKILGVLLLAFSMGCSNSSPTQAPPEISPNPPSISETFSGSFAQFGRGCNNFTTAVQGNSITTILSLEPVPTLTVGFGIGVPEASSPGGCLFEAADDTVKIGEAFSAFLQAGEHCSCIYDVGNLFPNTTVTYLFEVLHD